MTDPSKTLGISWPLSSLSGYGVVGLRIALSWLKSGRGELALYQTPVSLILNPLEKRLLAPALGGALAFESSHESFRPSHAVLHGVGNGMAMYPVSERLWGSPDIGVVVFENTHFTATELERVKRFDKLVTVSGWNARVLKHLGLDQVLLVHQGVATEHFHPRPRRGLLGGRFVVYSGGKLEYRKGQDLVLAAFRIFHQRHPEALLITTWQSPSAEGAAAFEAIGHVTGVPRKRETGLLDIAEWAAANGVPSGSLLDLGYVPNDQLPAVLAECDCALFPNRCEGGTNLVAMEALAMGLPCILSANTGHLDLLDEAGGIALTRQCPVRPAYAQAGVEGWGESDIAEILEALEGVYRNPGPRPDQAGRMAKWDWDVLNERLFQSL